MAKINPGLLNMVSKRKRGKKRAMPHIRPQHSKAMNTWGAWCQVMWPKIWHGEFWLGSAGSDQSTQELICRASASVLFPGKQAWPSQWLRKRGAYCCCWKKMAERKIRDEQSSYAQFQSEVPVNGRFCKVILYTLSWVSWRILLFSCLPIRK